MPRHTGRCGHRPLRTAYRNPMRHIRADRPVRPYIRLPSVRPVFSLSFRGREAPVGIRSPRPQARNLQSLPCVKGGVARRATEELLSPGGAEPRPYTRLSRRVPTAACGHAALRIICGGKTFPTSGQRPPPTFAALRQRRDLIIANPRRVFPKREGRSPPSLVAQGWGIFKGEGRSKLPFPLNGAFGYFCRY